VSNFDEKLIERLKRLEREVERLQVKERPAGGGVTDHGNLTGLGDNDHTQYLLTTGKAADSDKLDGVDSTGFATATHSHDHGTLTGLTDDDHTQYVKDAGTVTDNAIVRFNGTDGRTIQNSGVTIDDSNNLITTGGIHVGGTSNPGTDNLVVDGHANIVDYLTAEGGLHVGGTSDPGTDNLVVDGTIKDGSGNLYGRPVFLTTPKTSTSWDGDAYSTTAKTKIDLSTVFGVPAGVKAILVRLTARDSGSSAGYCQLGLSPNDTAGSVAVQAYLQGVANDVYVAANGVVPCDANGDIYYQITASGAGTLDAVIEIWGWWL